MPSSQQEPASQGRSCEKAIKTATVSLPAGFSRAGLTCRRVSPEVWAHLSQLGAAVQTALWPSGEGELGGHEDLPGVGHCHVITEYGDRKDLLLVTLSRR